MSDPSVPMPEPFDLERFVAAQEADFHRACNELAAGRKRTHWIWYVFPQLGELGRSATAKRYGIVSLAEARAYLAHPLLGARLDEASDAALSSGETDPAALFGHPDDMKVRSCLTLFLVADPRRATLRKTLTTLYGGEPDDATLGILGADRTPFA